MNQPPYPQYPPPQYPHYPPQQQVTANDLEHLKLLSIGYYIAAGFSLLFAFIPLIYMGMGLFIVSGRMPSSSGSPEPVGWIFVAIGSVVMFFIVATAVLNFLTARFIAARERRTFCIVIAALNCLHAPLGTLIGVFTIVVLSRDGVRGLFTS
jgi:uncharacterized membrane protein YedE/YeeE